MDPRILLRNHFSELNSALMAIGLNQVVDHILLSLV